MRQVININEGWKFIREDVGLPASLPADWCDVDLPHTWNALSGPSWTVQREYVVSSLSLMFGK